MHLWVGLPPHFQGSRDSRPPCRLKIFFLQKVAESNLCHISKNIWLYAKAMYMKKNPKVPHACTIKQLSVHLNLFFSLWENLMYIHFYRIKGRLRDPRKCTGKQMHRFVAGLQRKWPNNAILTK